MKKKISQWWFSVVCWFAAIIIPVMCIVDLFTNEEAFYKTTLFIGGAIMPAIIWIFIGEMNRPNMEKKDEKDIQKKI